MKYSGFYLLALAPLSSARPNIVPRAYITGGRDSRDGSSETYIHEGPQYTISKDSSIAPKSTGTPRYEHSTPAVNPNTYKERVVQQGTGTRGSPSVITGLSDFHPVEAYANPGNDGDDTDGGSPTGGATLPVGTGVTSIGNVTLPAGCESLNGIGIGWLPDADKGVPLSAVLDPLDNPLPCFVGYYSHITSSSSYAGDDITGKVADIKAAGKNGVYPIYITSVMPDIPFSQVPGIAGDIAIVMNEITEQGLTVWLRFAHEMNWYVKPTSGSDGKDSQYHGTSAEFQTAWAAVSQAVSSNPNVLMYWSPNYDPPAMLKSTWYPTSGAVDNVGIDDYPKSQMSFQSVYGSFCQTFPYLPFVVGETATGDSSAKTYWLQQLSGAQARTTCPKYLGWNWFEYEKEANFDVVTNGHTEGLSALGGIGS
ncbi:hypothetical protein MMC21_003245 [Puttea exsequens]|nr:hypothetical protein [Puttea exsequens]